VLRVNRICYTNLDGNFYVLRASQVSSLCTLKSFLSSFANMVPDFSDLCNKIAGGDLEYRK
jgi:hypothetical protein